MRPPHPLEVVATARRDNDLATRANTAAHIATHLFPGVVGEVLAAECRAVADFPWLGSETRSARLIEELLAMDVPMEETA